MVISWAVKQPCPADLRTFEDLFNSFITHALSLVPVLHEVLILWPCVRRLVNCAEISRLYGEYKDLSSAL